jgi:hypothetical protein
MRLLLLAVLMLPASVLAHGGGLDANGCHNNRKTGDYHCHRAQVSAVPQQAPARLPAQPEMPRGAPQQQLALNASMPASAAGLSVATQPTRSTLPPGCFVGPRGGTYTITKSGRKNYGGC